MKRPDDPIIKPTKLPKIINDSPSKYPRPAKRNNLPESKKPADTPQAERLSVTEVLKAVFKPPQQS